MTKSFVRVSAALLLAGAAACAGSTEPRIPQELQSLPRELSQAELDVRDAANQFAFTVFPRLVDAEPGRNVFVSPLSMTMSLGMALNGADGVTRAQMAQVLGFGDADLSTIRNGYRDLPALLLGLDPATSFRIANSIWHDQAYPFEQSFLDAGRTYFDAELAPVDFSDAAGTKKSVNDWVSAKTNGRIPTILEEVHPDDVMYLINAIWFKASWRSRFAASDTYDGQFTKADGSRQTVRMMMQTADSTAGFRAYVDPHVTAAELPYGNGAFAMTIVMPTTGTDVDALARSLTPALWTDIVASLQDRPGWEFHLPKFTLTYERELKDDLAALGMVDAVDPVRADFTGMSSRGGLYIAFVKHKTFVQVDEVGTEAAAVTNTGIREVSLPPGVRVDRPFVFAIRERLSGTILFIGKMAQVP